MNITPGPWKVVEAKVAGVRSWGLSIISVSADRLVAENMKESDARAITAVPEMVALLKEILQELSAVRNLWQLFHHLPYLIDKIAALLGRLEGKGEPSQ